MHERLHELSLEQQKGDQQRGYGHQRGRGDNRPTHAGFRGAEDAQSNRQGSGFHRVGHDEGPQEIVPVVADGDQSIGEIGRACQRHIYPP